MNITSRSARIDFATSVTPCGHFVLSSVPNHWFAAPMKLLPFLGVFVALLARASEFQVNGQKLVVPDGFEVELVAGPPLVDRPIVADFDELGRLYVADSSGSNDKL